MKVAFHFFAKDIFDIDHILVNAWLLFNRAAKAGAVFLFTENSFVDRLARYEVPPGVTVELIKKHHPKDHQANKVVELESADYRVYIFDTAPPQMHGKRLVVNLVEGTEQWILDC